MVDWTAFLPKGKRTRFIYCKVYGITVLYSTCGVEDNNECAHTQTLFDREETVFFCNLWAKELFMCLKLEFSNQP